METPGLFGKEAIEVMKRMASRVVEVNGSAFGSMSVGYMYVNIAAKVGMLLQESNARLILRSIASLRRSHTREVLRARRVGLAAAGSLIAGASGVLASSG